MQNTDKMTGKHVQSVYLCDGDDEKEGRKSYYQDFVGKKRLAKTL